MTTEFYLLIALGAAVSAAVGTFSVHWAAKATISMPYFGDQAKTAEMTFRLETVILYGYTILCLETIYVHLALRQLPQPTTIFGAGLLGAAAFFGVVLEECLIRVIARRIRTWEW